MRVESAPPHCRPATRSRSRTTIGRHEALTLRNHEPNRTVLHSPDQVLRKLRICCCSSLVIGQQGQTDDTAGWMNPRLARCANLCDRHFGLGADCRRSNRRRTVEDDAAVLQRRGRRTAVGNGSAQTTLGPSIGSAPRPWCGRSTLIGSTLSLIKRYQACALQCFSAHICKGQKELENHNYRQEIRERPRFAFTTTANPTAACATYTDGSHVAPAWAMFR